MTGPRALRLPLLALALSWATAAWAEPAGDARALYDEGAAAYDAKDYRKATASLARADQLAPNPVVLRLALASAVLGDDAVLGEELALRAEARVATGEIADLAEKAHRRFDGLAGRVRIRCVDAGCSARIGAATWKDGEVHAVVPGPVEATFEDRAPVQAVARAGEITDVVQPPAAKPPAPPAAKPKPAPPPPPRPAPRSGLSPAFFFIGTAATVALGAGTAVSGLDAKSQHQTFLTERTADHQAKGQSAELRTNVLIGATAAVGVATIAIGLFATRWGGDDRRPAALHLDPTGRLVF